ncbi:RNA polymerase sigma factor [Echinicola jeungdonensis]
MADVSFENEFEVLVDKKRLDINNPQEFISTGDVDLWNDFRKGNEGAFIRIYHLYANMLYNFGCQICSDHNRVKDSLQDFFIYLREKREKLGPTNSIKPYLLKAFKRRVLEDMKKNHKLMTHGEDFYFKKFPVELSFETKFIQQQFENEQLNQLSVALEKLGEKEREAVYYFYYEGLTYEQIGEIMGFSHISSARRLIYRALSQLRKFMLANLALLLVDIYSS